MRDVYYWLRGTSAMSPLVCFHFFEDANEIERVEIEMPSVQFDTGKRVVTLWEFCRDMQGISEEAMERS